MKIHVGLNVTEHLFNVGGVVPVLQPETVDVHQMTGALCVVRMV